MHVFKQKLFSGGLAVCFTLTSLFSPAMVAAAPNIQTSSSTTTTTSIFGNDQYETAAKIAQNGWTGTSDYAILAAGMSRNLIDALAAGPLAAKLNAPILLTEGNSLNKDAKDQLIRLKVKTVYITSGSAVIQQNVIDEVKTVASVTEVKSLGGYDASETSVNIAKEMANQGVKIGKVVVTGGAGSDALSMAPIAGTQGMPILYTQGASLSDYVRIYLDSLKASVAKTYVIGGTGVISEAVKAQIPGSVERYFGQTQYDTNIAVLKQFAGVLKNKTTYVANGETLVDALAGAPLAVKNNSLILLTGRTLPEASKKFAQANLSSNVIGLGGEAVVPAAVLNELVPVEIVTQDGTVKGSKDANSLEQINGILKVTANKVTVQNAKTDYSIYVTGDNVTLNNVTVNGTIFLDPGDNGTVTLQKVTANNIVVLSGGSHSINLINVMAQLLSNQSSSTGVHINASGGTKIERTESSASASFQAADGSFGIVRITYSAQSPGAAPVVELIGTFTDTIEVGGGVTVTAASGANISKLSVVTDKPDQTVTLKGIFNSVTVETKANVVLGDKSSVKDMVTNATAKITLPSTSTIGHLDTGSTGTTSSGGGTVESGTGSTGSTGGSTGGGGGGGGGGDVNPVKPAAPNVSRDDTANTVTGMAAGMEYNFDAAGYVAYNAATFNAISFDGAHTLLVRVAAVGINPASDVVTLTFTTNLVKPAAPTVNRDDTANTVTGMAVGMEYKLDAAGYVAYNANTFNAINFGGAHTLLVRVAAQGINPASDAVTLTFTTNPIKPAVPNVTRDDTTNKVTGMVVGMEYKLNNADYLTYDETIFNALDFSGAHSLLIRVAAEGINPASDPVTLTFTPYPAAPSSIIATAVSGTEVNVHWSSSVGAVGYRIYRDGNPVELSTVPGTGCKDTGLNYGSTHSYTVVAFNNEGPSLPSASASATTFAEGALIVSGVTNGAVINHDVTITAQSHGQTEQTVKIAETGSLDVTAPNVVDRTISSEGSHTLTITVIGGAQLVNLTFTIDKTAPTVTINGVNNDDKITNNPEGVTLNPIYDGEYLANTKSVLLDGNPFDITQAVKQPGHHTISASVQDAAGNIGTTTKQFDIVWDTTVPGISIDGVTDGSTYESTTPSITLSSTCPIAESNQANYTYTATITKPDGSKASYQAGEEFSTEGKYTINVVALNPSYVDITSQKSIQFWIDTQIPTVSINGVQNNKKYNTSVTPLINFGDSVATQALLKANSQDLVTLTKNGVDVPYSIGDTISDEGNYILNVSAKDGANHLAIPQSKSFTIDKTPPTITVTGVTDGTTYRSNVTMTVETDAQPIVLVNGQPVILTNSEYAFIGTDNAVTNNTVVITATDLADNTTSKQISFSIDKLTVSNIITGVTEGQFLKTLPTITFSAYVENVPLDSAATTATLDETDFTSGTTLPENTADGEHTLVVSTTYQSETYSKTIKFKVDRTAPTVSVTSVKKGDVPVTSPLYVKAGDIITVTATVTDNLLLQSQSFSIDSAAGSVSGEIPLTEVAGVLTGTWTVGGGNSNNLVLNVTGKDKAGNSKKTAWSQPISIDNTPPGVTLITTPATPDGDNGYFKAANMTIQLQAVPGETITYTFNNVAQSPVNTGTVPLTAEQGHNSLTYQVQDQAGNSSDPTTFDFEYDSVVPSAPVVTLPVLNSTGRSSTVTIDGTSEAGSTVIVRKAGVDLAEGTAAQSGSFSVNGVSLSEGNNALTLVTVDYAGNESLPRAHTLVLDSAPPVLAVTKVDDTHYNVSVNEPVINLAATFNGTSILAGSISGPDASGMYVITTPPPQVGANALFLSASDAAGNLATGSLTSSYIAPAVAQSNLEVSGNAMMDIPADAFSSATQMTVRTGTFAGDSTFKLLGGSLSFNFSEKPATEVILKILVGTGLKGVTLFHIDEAGAIVAIPFEPPITNAEIEVLVNAGTMKSDKGYYLSDTGYVWLKTKNFSDYQAALDSTPPVINFTVTDPVIRINKPGKLGGQMKLEGTVSDLDPLATITGIEIDGVSTPALVDPVTNNVSGKSFNIPLSLSDGQHKVKLTAEDSAENSTTVKKTFIVDATPPEFKKATLEGYVVKDGDVYVTNTDGVVLNYTLSKNAEVFVNGQSVGTKNGVNSLTLSLPGEGNNTFVIKAIDPFGNEVSETFTIRKDTKAPRLTIEGVSDGGVYGGDLLISVTSNEGLTPLVSIDGVKTSNTFSYSAEGMHTLTATVTDLAGNTTTKTVSFTVDASSPTVVFEGVSNGQTYSTEKTLTITATNALQVFLTKIVDNGSPETVILDKTGGSVDVLCAEGEEHTYTFVAMAMRITDDGAIKMSNQTVTFKVDRKAPSLTFILEAVDNMTGSVSLSGTLDEIADVRVYLNESTAPIVTLTGQPAGSFVISNIALSMGDNTIKLVATDMAGLPSTPVSKIVRRVVSVKSMTASNGQLALTFSGDGSTSLTKDDFTLTAKLNSVDYELVNLAYTNGVFTFTPLAKAAQDQVLEFSLSPSTASTKLGSVQGSPQKITVLANTAPLAPNVSADDVNNVIVGIDSMMEYSLNAGSTYIRYSSASPPDLKGNVTVLVRLAASTSFPAGTPKALVFTLNPVVLTGIAITTTPATKLVYTVGEALDITGLVVTGTYSDNTTKVETITAANVTGFNSTNPVTSQTLTITLGGNIATYTVVIQVANIPTTQEGSLLANGQGGTAPQVVLTYTLGENYTNGQVVFTLPTCITALASEAELSNGTISNDGQVVTINSITANQGATVVLTLHRDIEVGSWVFSVNGDADGSGPKASTNEQVTLTRPLDSSPAFNQFVDKLMEMYVTLSETDKAVLLSARKELQDLDLTNSCWDDIVTPMLTTEVVGRYGSSSEDAKDAISQFVKDFSLLQYSGDRKTLEGNLNTFRTNNRETFRTLLGNDFTMDQLYNYLVAAQEALPGVINSSDVDILDLVGKTNPEIKEQIVDWTRAAMLEVSTTTEYHTFTTKLSALGWNIDMLVEAQRQLGEVIDLSNAAEKALTLAAIRSQILCTPSQMTVGVSNQFVISVKGVTTPFNLAGLLDWYSSESLVATIQVGSATVVAVGQGDTIITAYKKGSTPGTSNAIVRMTLTVKSPSVE